MNIISQPSLFPATNIRPHIHRLVAGGAVVALTALLTACGSTGGATTTNTPAATATATTPALATAAPASASDIQSVCDGAFANGYQPEVYKYGDLYAEAAFALSYPSYALPAGTALKPFDIGSSLNGSDLDPKFGGAPNANPHVTDHGAVIFTICNNGPTAVTLNGVSVGILNFASHASPIDTWQICDGAYQNGAANGGGCGGGITDDLAVSASFPAGATTGATATASMVSVDDFGGTTYTALPTQVPPSATIILGVEIVPPTTPGVYTFGITFDATGNNSAQYAPLAPQLFAQVAHKWDGNACKDPSVSSQIPSSSQDYWICPNA